MAQAKLLTATQRQAVKRLIARAVAQAERSGNVMAHKDNLWRLAVEAARKPRKG